MDKFVKQYNEITFSNFYQLKYNFVFNILYYEKTKNEYEQDYQKNYSDHIEKNRKKK